MASCSSIVGIGVTELVRGSVEAQSAGRVWVQEEDDIAACVGGNKGERVVSRAEVEQHCSAEETWIVVDGEVYDITGFLGTHPGGSHVILEHAQEADVGKLMRGKNAELHSHSKAAFRMLHQFLVGRLQQESHLETKGSSGASRSSCMEVASDASGAFQVDLSKPIVCQVGYLGDKYDAWVHEPVISNEIPRFFQSDFFEFFTQTKWWVIPLLWVPVAIAMGVYARRQGLASKLLPPCFLLGVLMWTLMEYLMHRFVFHMKTSSHWGNTLHYVVHGFHHKHPMDGTRLVFPPAFTLLILTALWLVVGMSGLPRGISAALVGGVLLGYVCYDLTHYFLHFGVAFNQTSRKMKRYHLNHHFKVQSQGFGVMSWSMWDKVFGTLPDKSSD